MPISQVLAEPLAEGAPLGSSELVKVLGDYREYLIQERGLANQTVAGYLSVARQFLSHVARADGVRLSNLDAKIVLQFVLRAAQHRCVGSTKHVVTGLRSLLRFLHVAGHAPELAASVPAVAGWRGTALPRALPAGAVDRLLASCDRQTAAGRRDRAILLLLARLGLRVGELVRLELSDFDWRTGEVTIRGKARRQERLPLPVDVGEAVAAYILGGRPPEKQGRLFVSAGDPARCLSAKRVRTVLRETCRRAGIPAITAHVLRHTAATELLRAGASLIEVGQVLRHRSVSTTTMYAKVDRERLRALARPWPETEA
jgi:site-specific recombinase XerD